ncbi:MAG: hypothetical protein WBE79_10795 [Candidatus Cybelea sp.]|jgi:hypothetical protein
MPLFALLTILLAAAPASQSPRTHPTANPTPATLSPDEIFSRRALRRARLIIQMRMFQLRDERLECVREALLRRLPDALWPELPEPSRGTSGAAVAASRCERLLDF